MDTQYDSKSYINDRSTSHKILWYLLDNSNKVLLILYIQKNICSSYARDKCCKKFTICQKKHPRFPHSTLINHQLQKNTKAKVVINNFYKKKVPLKF